MCWSTCARRTSRWIVRGVEVYEICTYLSYTNVFLLYTSWLLVSGGTLGHHNTSWYCRGSLLRHTWTKKFIEQFTQHRCDIINQELSADEDPRVETSWYIILHLCCVNCSINFFVHNTSYRLGLFSHQADLGIHMTAYLHFRDTICIQGVWECGECPWAGLHNTHTCTHTYTHAHTGWILSSWKGSVFPDTSFDC